MSRLHRRHDKLLRRYLELSRQVSASEERDSPEPDADRSGVRMRALLGSIRRIRLRLDLPEAFDAEHELARLGPKPTSSRRARQANGGDTGALSWTERPRVKPVPAPSSTLRDVRRSSADLTFELVSASARYFGRRAADEVVLRRQSSARDHASTPTSVWPRRPLARTANGDIYAGSAGALMGEIVARAIHGNDAVARRHASLAVRGYIDEFTATVLAALNRERAAARPHDQTAPSDRQLAELRRELAWACCRRIAAEARSVRATTDVSADHVADLAELSQAAESRRGRPVPPSST